MLSKPIYISSAPPMDYLLSHVAKKVGYPTGKPVPQDKKKRIRSIIEKGLACIETRYIYKVTPVVSRDNASIYGKDIVIESSKWATLLNHMQAPFILYCFTLTLGKKMDEMIKATQDTSLFDAFVMDAFGSVIAEYEADQLTHYLTGLPEAQSREFSRRFSPGYCDWNLQPGQDRLFHFLQPEAIGLTCLSSGAMVPVKSISAVMVAARKVNKTSPCFFCDERSCAHRRSG